MKRAMKKAKKRSHRASPSEALAREAFEEAYEIKRRGDLAKARRAYERAARLGSPHAQINLANLYDDGEFGRRNRLRAIALYKRAARRGFPEAAYNLAQLYRRDCLQRWYAYWLRKAAKLGDSDAKEELRALKAQSE